jgi:hypothetical protein
MTAIQIRIDSVYIFEELTQFNFASNDSAWFAPAADFAYESIYKQLPLSEIKDAATPFTDLQKQSTHHLPFMKLH